MSLFCSAGGLSFSFHCPHCFLRHTHTFWLFPFYLCFLVIQPPYLHSPRSSPQPVSSQSFLYPPLLHILLCGGLFALLSCSPSLFCLLADNRGILHFAPCRSQQTVYLELLCSRLTVISATIGNLHTTLEWSSEPLHTLVFLPEKKPDWLSPCRLTNGWLNR